VSEEFQEQDYWNKVKNYAVSAGKDVVEKSLCLYYAAQRPETPLWAKTTIYSALAYFIMPLDALPDITPLVGYTDDLGALALAVGTVAAHITQDVKEQASAKLTDWFK
jgi:uncharacterized membrane protein YkvA (DUF1232 family)